MDKQIMREAEYHAAAVPPTAPAMPPAPAPNAAGPAKLARSMVVGLAVAVVAYTLWVLWADFDGLRSAFARLPAMSLVAACALSFANYLVRFARWQLYLRWLGCTLPPGASFRIHLAGLALTVSPGKLGEAVKSWLLLARIGAPVATTAPIVVAERATDLLGFLALLAVCGSSVLDGAEWIAWSTLALLGLLLSVLWCRPLQEAVLARAARRPALAGAAAALRGSLASSRSLMSPARLLGPTLLAAAGWFLECLGFHLLASTFGPLELAESTAIFALGALAGAVAFLAPGGVGVTEASMTALLRHRYASLGVGGAAGAAAAATLAARLCTLWFAVGVGWIALWLERRAIRRHDAELSN
jgi:uncharacterized membrane protein YbhN (UPF0104 family)